MTEEQMKKLLEENSNAFLEKFDAKLDQRLEENNAILFGQMSRHFDDRFAKQDAIIATRFDRLENTVGGIAKRIDDDDQERAATDNQLARHKAWLGQLADATNTKLVPEQ